MMDTIVEGSRTEGTAWLWITINAAYASGILATVGLVFLILFFAGVPVFGPLNDIAVIIQYLLLLPIMFRIHSMLATRSQKLRAAALMVGLAGAIAVIVLQSMLVLGLVTFRRQITLVIPAFLICMLWFVLVERLGGSKGYVPAGTFFSIMAGLVVGYPFWAFKLAKNLEAQSKGGSL
jgi:hypothetical protein